MGWIECESFWLFCPTFADVFVRCEAFEGLEATTEVVGGDEVSEVLAKLIMALIIIAFDCRILDGPVHSFDLAIGPRMLRLGRSVFDIGLGASIFEGMRPEFFAVCDRFLDERNGRTTSPWGSELDAIVGKNGMDLVWDSCDQA